MRRIGTVSPWSSKATDIAQGCGLDFIDLVERGIAFGVSGGALPDTARPAVAAILHDRMTQSVLQGLDAGKPHPAGKRRHDEGKGT